MTTVNITSALVKAEEEHAFDAVAALILNVMLISCLLAAYYVKRFRLYHLPESALWLLVGVVAGGIARLTTDNLQLFEFVSVLFLVCLFVCFLYRNTTPNIVVGNRHPVG